MKYCEFCKKPIPENEQCSCPQAQEKVKSGKKKLRKFLCIGIAIVAVIAIVAIIIGMASEDPAETQLDPFEYIEATFSGYNTKGKVTVSFAEDRLIEAIVGPEPESIQGYEEWSSKYDLYAQNLALDYSPRENLSNGDKVTVSVSATGAAADKIQSGEKTFTVTGLTEIQMIDFFKDLIVTYEGVNGGAKAVLTCQTDDEALNACVFSAKPLYNLASGDSITVTISNVDYLAETYNCIPAETEKTYTVPALAEYVQSADQLPLDTIKALAEKLAADWQREDIDLLTYSETTYYGTYFCFPHTDGIMVEENLLLIFVVYDEYYMGEFRRRIYQPFHFPNIAQAADGTVTLDYESGFAGDFSTEIEDHIEQFRNYYDVTEVEINDYDGELIPDSTLPVTPTEPEPTDPAPSDPTPTTPPQQTPTTPEEEPSQPPTEETQPPSETTVKEDLHTHSYTSTVVAPTCTQDGYTRHTCSCGQSYDDSTVPAVGHLYGDWKTTVEPTTESSGEKQCACSRCGATITESIPAIKSPSVQTNDGYVDPRVEITSNGSGAKRYYYSSVSLVDTRSWGSQPSISITSEGGFQISYFKADGSKVYVSLTPAEGYVRRCVILEDGSYTINLIGDYSD